MKPATLPSEAKTEAKMSTSSKSNKSSKSTSKAPKTAASNEGKETAGRRQALDRALGQIEKAYGGGSIMRLESDSIPVIPSVSTGTSVWISPSVVAAFPAVVSSKSSVPSHRARPRSH